MKLLQINVSANIGSTGKIADQIGKLAITRGWESYIIYGRSALPSESHIIKIGNKFTILYHVLITRLFDKHGLGSRIATYRLIKKIRSINPDIIHLHNIHGYYLNYKILFKHIAKYGIPVVWTLHDCWAITGHCAHFEEVGCTKWKERCYACPLIGAYPKSFTDRSRKNHQLKIDLISKISNNLILIPVSNWLKSTVDSSLLSRVKSEVIYNGIDLNSFRPSLTSLSYSTYKQIVLGVSSIWNQSKGLNDFIKLRSILPSEVLILLVGLDPKQINLLPSGILGIERTNSLTELSELYSSADVFVNPTYADTFPTVNLEALACGTPIITYNTGGATESVTPDTGIVVEKGNVEQLNHAILKVLEIGKSAYSKACRQYAELYFDKNVCFQKYFKVYSEILSSKELQ